jgi:hypothetical protein
MEDPTMLRSTGDCVVIVGGGIAGALDAPEPRGRRPNRPVRDEQERHLIDPYVMSKSAIS